MQLLCGRQRLDLSTPVVMGIVNVTPDSFSDGGRFLDARRAVEHGRRLVEEGAAILDIGGESTRPGAMPVSVDEELRRVIPVIEGLAGEKAILSIDTSKPAVMKAAAAAGAGLINDVYALRLPGALETAAESGCAVCLMHMQGEPRTMQQDPRYGDVVNEVKAFLAERVQSCRALGIPPERIAIDPGFGFGKTLAHNAALLRGLDVLAAMQPAQPDGMPLLVGLSRKSMLGKILGKPADERVYGSIALAVMAVLKGARIVRAHDVAATVDAMKTVAAIQEWRAES
ncbi:MAG TPA: dihydropteroate synthase [Steroidobacteraceae bacterium]|jgi:dihydropteroate synthase|nr:dihydropteroate synthase [Steroidobacteraceae bacterium]